MHPANERFDRDLPKKACDHKCPNYRFDHLDTACVLSDVYSVKKGEQCAIYAEEIDKAKAMRLNPIV